MHPVPTSEHPHPGQLSGHGNACSSWCRGKARFQGRAVLWHRDPALAQCPLVELLAWRCNGGAAGGGQQAVGCAAVKGFLFAFSCCYKSSKAAQAPRPLGWEGSSSLQPAPHCPVLARDELPARAPCACLAPSPLQEPGRDMGGLDAHPRLPALLQGFVHPSPDSRRGSAAPKTRGSAAASASLGISVPLAFGVVWFKSSRTQHFSALPALCKALQRQLLLREIDVLVRFTHRRECAVQNSCWGLRRWGLREGSGSPGGERPCTG